MANTIIEVAVSGSSRIHGSRAPSTLDEISRDILECIALGAGVVHNHIDDFNIAGPEASARYGRVWKPVLETHPDAILIPTLAAPLPEDPLGGYGHLLGTMRTGASLAPLDPGSVNMTGGRPDGQPDPQYSAAFVNDYALIDRVLDHFAANNIPASISVWDPTFLRAAMAYERAGRLVKGSFLKLFFGGSCSYLDGSPGVSFGLPPTVAALDIYLEMMEGSHLPWAAAVLGGNILAEGDFVRAVVARGGHLRVGLEDFAGEGTPTNAQLVAQAAALVAQLGRPAASLAESRHILGLAAD